MMAVRGCSFRPIETGVFKSLANLPPPPKSPTWNYGYTLERLQEAAFLLSDVLSVHPRLAGRSCVAQRPRLDGRAAARVRAPAGSRVLVGPRFAAWRCWMTAVRGCSLRPMKTGIFAKLRRSATPPQIADL